uniref:GGDEF domain-containing protein n=1 Tax=Fundidesulfovibrio putealis TaxID=270496 RepID=A0A7C4EJT9_9BACT
MDGAGEQALLARRVEELEKDVRILRKKLERSEDNRAMLEEALESHILALKSSNAELTRSQQAALESEARYREMALYDPLTSLPSRHLLQERLDRAIFHAQRSGLPMAVLFVDLDNFKHVNDTGGHEIGDVVLCETAARLLSCVRSVDTVSRLSGDEFVILLESVHSRHEVKLVARRINVAVAAPVVVSRGEYRVSASIGISVFPQDGGTSSTLLKNADAAMYHVKRNGRSSWSFYCELGR